jgi:hypothetical protein
MVPLAGALASLGAGGALLTAGCTEPRSPAVGRRFEDRFERAELGPDWRVTGEGWRVEGGALRGQGVRNHPLWLRRKLPRDARIEFDAWSDSPAGDLKCEAWGDGSSHAVQASYTATSYVVIFGGWNNSYNVIARMDEHAPDRRQRVGPRVEMGRHYHFTIERRGRVLRWLLDGAPMLEWDDPDPLAGPGHEYFAFNDWDAVVHFDNLVITPL